MPDIENSTENKTGEKKRRGTWNYHPPLPLSTSVLFDWPPKFWQALKWNYHAWLFLTDRLLMLALAVLVWHFLPPVLEACKTFAPGWFAQIYARNMILTIVVAGGLHWFFYSAKKQGKTLKYDHRDMATDSPHFNFRRQVWDNMFWTLSSAVLIWSGYEALFYWLYANGWNMTSWDENPLWFLALFLIIPMWQSFHFYWIHRFLHLPPLYKTVHSLHHRNMNVGPWSGLSMHPIEHLIYLSSPLIHLLLPSHPIHVIFHCYWLALGAITTHTGYEGLIANGKKQIDLGTFFHQLHHRYYECNYGNYEMPWDRWFGSFHNGTEEANARIAERRKKIYQAKRAPAAAAPPTPKDSVE